MAGLEHVQNLPFEPGDIVRDRKSRTDYVIQSVATTAGGVGFVIIAITLLDNKLREFDAESEEGLGLMMIRRNVEEMEPEQVIQSVRTKAAKHLRDHGDLLQKLNTKEGGVYRDLLMVGDDVPEHLFREKIIEYSSKHFFIIIFPDDSKNKIK